MFDDSDDELDEFVRETVPAARMSRRELNNAKTRIRGYLSREAKDSRRRENDMASYIISHAAQMADLANASYTKRKRKLHAVIVSISKLSSSVLSSLDVRVPAQVSLTHHSGVASASTDFKSITISVNPNTYDEDNRNSISSLIHMTKGLMYHEGGHIKFTTPFIKLMEMADKQRVDSYSKYDLSRAWNVLEDQRMETAMCTVSPVMSKYFTNIVINIVINLQNIGANWPWIAGRTYLPADIRQAVRNAAEEYDTNNIIDDINACVMGYRSSKDANEMMSYVIRFSRLLKLWGSPPRFTDSHEWVTGSDDGSPMPMPEDIPDAPAHDMEQPSAPAPTTEPPAIQTPSDKPSDGDGKPKPEDDKSSDEPSDKSAGDTTNTGGLGAKPSETKTDPDTEEQHGKEASFKNRLNEEVASNIDTVTDSDIDEFVATVNETLAKGMLPDPTKAIMTEEQAKETDKVSNSMMSVLERLIVQVDPTWHSFMEEGVLDPTAFRLRDPGDTNFWSGLDGEGGNGHDVSLSVMVDSSGSMAGYMHQASIAAIGIRKACDELGIPCTITTFNDDVYMLADATETVGYIRAYAKGGTSVVNAMMALDEQRHNRRFHMVIILTDGEWSDVKDTRMWSSATRSITIVGLGHNMSRYISDKGADHWLTIENLEELPNIVTDSLVRHFV